ncbi:AraC family transcriptional regulator [Sphingomonas oligophenolica]|uniref:AraC family transcriptional regulator n=1 Tax=Sphingomonas oligophenolica TaxID=301154 RepID=UPI00138696E8|nr:helix-turn-helix domain-containing protein [Sphingomonas oligophenolica]
MTDFLYPEWGNVRFSISGSWMVRMPGYEDETPQTAVLFGPTDRHGAIDTKGGRTIGFGLTPIGWQAVIGGDAGAMANRVVPLGDRLGISGEQLRAHLIRDKEDQVIVERLEELLTRRLASRPPVSKAVLATDRALRMRPRDLAAFAAAAGVSARTLHRLCLGAFGFPPKRLMRLQRFLDTLGQVRTAVGNSVRNSMDEAYCDQSHFYRDFRDFMAMTPREYFGAPRLLMAAAAEAQVRAGVTLSFRLPPSLVEEDSAHAVTGAAA